LIRRVLDLCENGMFRDRNKKKTECLSIFEFSTREVRLLLILQLTEDPIVFLKIREPEPFSPYTNNKKGYYHRVTSMDQVYFFS
jgi:hypothetical protein